MALAAAYRVDLTALQAACEANYRRLQRLLPSWRNQAGQRVLVLGALHSQRLLQLSWQSDGPYTTTVELREKAPLAWLAAPLLQVRAYHDARMAEVVAVAGQRHLLPRYGYPNPRMNHPDEKSQLNLYLGEWLGHYLSCGHLPENPLESLWFHR